MTDPFGDLEQQVEEIKTVAKKEKEAVGDKTEAVGTIKGGAGFDSPWLVIHAADVSDLRAVLVEDADEIVDILEGLWKASLKFQSFGAVAGKQQAARKAAGAQSVSEVLSQAPPAGASDAPGGEVRHCKHGQMVLPCRDRQRIR